MHKKIVYLLFSAIISASAQTGMPDSNSAHKAPVDFTNQKFPNIPFVPLHGKPFELKDLKGKVVVINWWFTTCSPCQYEIPLLNKLVHKYKDENIAFIAIARNTESELLKYFTNNIFDYQQTIVTDTIRSLFDYYFPRNVVIDKNGIVVGDYVGFAAEFTEPQLDKTISDVLKKER